MSDARRKYLSVYADMHARATRLHEDEYDSMCGQMDFHWSRMTPDERLEVNRMTNKERIASALEGEK